MHFCGQELLVLLTLMDNVPVVSLWLTNIREKAHVFYTDSHCTISP